MASTVAAMLAACASYYGYTEGPNNDTLFGRWYGIPNSAWCDEYVSKCGEDSGNADVVGHFAYTPNHVAWSKSIGRWHDWSERDFQVGDIVFFDWDGTHGTSSVVDHVGVIIALTGNADNPFVSREGNSGVLNTGAAIGVFDHNRSIQWVAGVHRPAYNQSSSAASGIPAVLTSGQGWDGSSFPGRSAFALGSMHPAVTKLGQMLVAHGFGGAYKVGPGVPMGQADVTNCRAFQQAQGWSGADADGYPGPETWSRLSASDSPAPAPAPAPVTRDIPTQGYQGNVYLGKLHRGQQDSDSVRVFQQALRNYPDISTIPLNPSGATGNYGAETEAMCRLVYQTFDQWQPGQGWGDGDLGVPGRGLLDKLGCRIVG